MSIGPDGPALSVGRPAGPSFAADGAFEAFFLVFEFSIEIAPAVSGPAVELVAAAAGFVGGVPISKLLQYRIGEWVECAHERPGSFDARQSGRKGCGGGAQFVAGLL